MITLRISNDEERAWLDCGFCGVPNEYALAARLSQPFRTVIPFPTLSALVGAHYHVNATDTHGFAPCRERGRWRDDECQVVDADSGSVVRRGFLRWNKPAGSFSLVARADDAADIADDVHLRSNGAMLGADPETLIHLSDAGKALARVGGELDEVDGPMPDEHADLIRSAAQLLEGIKRNELQDRVREWSTELRALLNF